jgi:kumamolisin
VRIGFEFGRRPGRWIAVITSIGFVASVASVGASGAVARAATPLQRRVVVLGLRQRGNPARFASLVSNPSSRQYRRFLSLPQFRARYAPSRADRQQVLRYLGSQRGVVGVQQSSDRSVVVAIVTPQMGRRLFCARTDAEPTGGLCIPRALRPAVQAISAGEVFQVGATARDDTAPNAGRLPGQAARRRSCAGTGKTHAFTPGQLATAYGVDPLSARGLTGAGVRVATLSSQEVPTAGFRTWARCFGLRTPAVRQFAMPGGTRDTGTAPDETVLDVEALASFAPGLARITPIFVPLDQSFSNSFVLFMVGALDPSRQGGRLPNILSISDGVCESRFTRDQLRLGERLLTEAAALGITALAASGDLGFQGCFINKSGAMFPGSSPFVTSVGGTYLALSPRNLIASQVVWSTYATQPSQGVGSGGGPSHVWARPSFQRAPGIRRSLQRGAPMRLEPDIAAMASFTPGLAVFDAGDGGWGVGGGTSAATPLTAGIVALALQQERRARRPGLGSLPPLLYALARGPRYRSIFFDVTLGTSSRRPKSRAGRSPAGGAAQRGYDLATGLGSLKAAGFAAAVSRLH